MRKTWYHLLCLVGPNLTALAHSSAAYLLPPPRAAVRPTDLPALRTHPAWQPLSLPILTGSARDEMHYRATSSAYNPQFILTVSYRRVSQSEVYLMKSTIMSRCVQL